MSLLAMLSESASPSTYILPHKIKDKVTDVYVWISPHVESSDGGVGIWAMIQEDGKGVIVGCVDDTRASVSTAQAVLAKFLYQVSQRPVYSKATIHILHDANPLHLVRQHESSIQRIFQDKLTLNWPCLVAGMPDMMGVSAGVKQRNQAWKVLCSKLEGGHLKRAEPNGVITNNEELSQQFLRLNLLQDKPSRIITDLALLFVWGMNLSGYPLQI
jgi:hypothetical protein